MSVEWPNMRKKSSFFRRELAGSPHEVIITSTLDPAPTCLPPHPAEAASSHHYPQPVPSHTSRDPLTLQRPYAVPPVPPVPPVPSRAQWDRETDGPSVSAPSYFRPSLRLRLRLRPESQSQTAPTQDSPPSCPNPPPPAESVLGPGSRPAACPEEPTGDEDTAPPISYQLSLHPASPLQLPHHQPGLRSVGPSPTVGSSNKMATATGEQPPPTTSSPQAPASHSGLPSLQASPAPEEAVPKGESLRPSCSRASPPHRPSAHGLSSPSPSTSPSESPSPSLSTTTARTGPDPSNSKAQKPSRGSSSITPTATSPSPHLGPTTPTHGPPLAASGPSLPSRAASVSSLLLDPPTAPLFCPPPPPPPPPPPSIPTVQQSEEDRLQLSLETWKLDQDGVLQGGPSSSSSPSQTPMACQSSFTLSASGRSSIDLEKTLDAGDCGCDCEPRSSHQVDSSSLKSLSSFFSAASDLSDPHWYASRQDRMSRNSDHPSPKISPPTAQVHSLQKFPSENPVPPPSLHCLSSLVNPKLPAMQSNSTGEPASKPSTCPAANAPRPSALANRLRTAPSSYSAFSPPPPGGPPNPHSSFDAFHYSRFSAATHSSLPLLSPTGSLQQSPNSGIDGDPDAPVKFCCQRIREGTPDPAESPSPSQGAVGSSHTGRHSPKPSQPSTKTPGRLSIVTSLRNTTFSDDFSQIGQHLSPLSPSIRLVSPTTQASAAFQPEIANPSSCGFNSRTFPISSSPMPSQPTPSTPPTSRKPTLEFADLVPSSMLTARVSPNVRINSNKTAATKLVKRGSGGLGKQPTHQTNSPFSTLKTPLLHSGRAEKVAPINHSARPAESRTPRSHQSSPNLRDLHSPLQALPDLPFFSAGASKPTPPNPNPLSISPDDESENLNLPSGSGSRQSSVSSVDLNASLLVPGMTVEANALRLAEMFWQEDETIIKQQKLTEWLGSPESNANQLQALTRRAFLDRFDFKDLRIDVAFRKLCAKMYLKGETQQVDRILAEFSRRYWEQNQSTIYVNPDMVHALSYSILLLNTDLHVVDTVSRMSRPQFIRNTMETIGVQLSHLDFPEANHPKTSKESPRPSTDTGEAVQNTSESGTIHRPRRTSIIDVARTPFSTVTSHLDSTRPSMERWREALRSGSQTVHQPRSAALGSSEDDAYAGSDLDSTTSETPAGMTPMDQNSSYDMIVTTPPASDRPDEGARMSFFSGEGTGTSVAKEDKLSKAQLERELEALLKGIYAAIKTQPIAQSLAKSHPQNTDHHGSLKRITSRRSHNSHAMGERNASSKRASFRGFSGLFSMLPVGAHGPPSRPTSPTPSSSFSSSSGMMGYSSNGGSSLNLTNYTTPSIGFVSNLSQSIIREQNEEELEPNRKTDERARDSKLALLGAPWAKEGILQRKQYWESKGKRHKDKGWAEVFVVIQAGTLQMFQFGQSTGGRRAGSASAEAARMNSDSSDQKAVGGGNWLPNAHLVGEIGLSHALTSILVSGYSKDRAHVFVLTLSNGASYFFQTGTEELVHEWVSTCNYWAARLSKEPLTGGVSNMEYGWNQLLEMDFIGSSEKKEELQDCQREQEEMMSIGSGQSEHSSHKARQYLLDRIFNGLPLGSSILSNQVAHAARVNDLHNWSTSGSSLNSLASPLGSTASSKINLERHSQRPSPAPESKLVINDWNPPVPPMALSSLPETAQMENLRRHTSHIQKELEEHNSLTQPLVDLYASRPGLLQKAMANWEKKSQYLMAEIIKYTTYLNALEHTALVLQALTSPLPG